MLRDALSRICLDFKTAREGPFASHLLAEFIRGGAAGEVQAALGELAGGLICKGSAGAGNWAEVPWLAVFDPFVTDSATRGYYVVYLFAADGSRVCLSLNQGTTAVRREFTKQARAVLRDRAVLMRHRLADWVKQFELQELALESPGTLPRNYEAGHAFGRTLFAMIFKGSCVPTLRLPRSLA